MEGLNKFDIGYKDWLLDIKSKVRGSQVKAALAANAELILFYWELGRMISEKQKETKWGDGLIRQLSIDLKEEFPELGGFSERNLKHVRAFYLFYNQSLVIGQQPVAQLENGESRNNEIVQQAVALLGNAITQQAVGFLSEESKITPIPFTQQLVAKIPWGQNILIFSKAKDVEEAVFYIQQTIENGWSRDVLALQIKTALYQRQGKSITNFKTTLPDSQSDLAQQTLKDPYIFDFMMLTSEAKEKDIENQMVEHITKFLLELGKGFAFVGRQYAIEIADEDYKIDLLFYNIKLKCYVVIELKNKKFAPEYAGKLNFYLSAIDDLLKGDDDKATIGILLCRDKNNIAVEYALRDIVKPIGVSEFQFTEVLPDEIKSSLPTIEEIENEFKDL